MRRRPASPTGRARISVVGVIGELLITAGVFVFLFLGWQLWLNDIVVGSAQREDAIAFSRELGSAAPPTTPLDPETDFGDPLVSQAPAETVAFANIYIPRFGDDYVRTIAEGVDASNVLRTGVGHYPGTQMPGEVGNFAVAAHRTTYGAPFNRIAELTVGDRIHVQTADGWYTYVFRSLEYVLPTAIEVLAPVPHAPGMAASERIITLTSCNPMLSAAERIVAYGVFEEWQPASAGPPEELANLNMGGA
jgi:sortase A